VPHPAMKTSEPGIPANLRAVPELKKAIEELDVAARATVKTEKVLLKKVGMTVHHDGVRADSTPLGLVIASTLRFFLVKDETWAAWVRGDVTFDALCVVGVTVQYDEDRDGWTMEVVK
jgi:hypothetical protein